MLLDDIDQLKFIDESRMVAGFQPPYDSTGAADIERLAATWVATLRAEPRNRTVLDTFLSEYGLSNEEGVALMCLAEAFLRIPDSSTAQDLIVDKLLQRDWAAHDGHADSWLVNASTWALMLTGSTLKPVAQPADAWLQAMLNRLGKPVVERAVRTAMQILGGEFVLGETVEDALNSSLKLSEDQPNTSFSFDMLGEGARDAKSAALYEDAYLKAIEAVGEEATGKVTPGNSVSIKLSALHPRYEARQLARLEAELLPRLVRLCRVAREHAVPITIDAEEADRLSVSLHLFARLAADPALAGWSGLGMVVQAYGKRAPAVITWLNKLGKTSKRQIPVRLVKGAYWDAEIKHAQSAGFDSYPVYTRKVHTDAAYLVCAQALLQAPALIPQFATHNAHTIAAILHLAPASADIEFQRLHGMGEHLYAVVRRQHPSLNLRIYAPVGRHEHLLAYLVRRLLENGANSSFVNRLHDAALPAEALTRDPFRAIESPHMGLTPPPQLYQSRANSGGLDLSQAKILNRLRDRTWQHPAARVRSLTSVTAQIASSTPLRLLPTFSPSDSRVQMAEVEAFPLTSQFTGPRAEPLAGIDAVFTLAAEAQRAWDELGGPARAVYLRSWADLLEVKRDELYELLCFEAGKTAADCVDEVREAIDFCRYYAELAEQQFAQPLVLPGPAGEHNTLRLRGRGVFVCISPWNFPLAIFVGQVAAALLAGNAVIAKPAPDTPLIAMRAIQLLHATELPENTCQLLFGGAELGSALVGHQYCAGVVFTGSTATAQHIQRSLCDAPPQAQRAIVPLIAETGGQNGMIVDSSALLEQVVDDVIRSAFGSAGQRCSALRVLYLQEDIAPQALALLKGAMQELSVGHPADPATDIGPVISADALSRLHQHLQNMRTRGARVYQPDLSIPSTGHYLVPALVELEQLNELQGEVFGPILHVRRYTSDELDLVVDEINATGYGLTFGVHTRIESRANALSRRIRAGNVYVNRNMIGAVVGSQPFGGSGLSGTGPKAGGPNYLLRFSAEQTISVNTAAQGGDIELLSGRATGLPS